MAAVALRAPDELGAAELPRIEWDYPACIYFLVERGEVVYVGRTASLVSRVAQHRAAVQNCGVRKSFDQVFYIACDEDLLDLVEGGLIKILNPRDNRTKFGEGRCRVVSVMEERALRRAGLASALRGHVPERREE